MKEVGIDKCAISEITVTELLYGAYCSKQPEDNIRLIEEFCKSIRVLKISNVIYDFAFQKSILRQKGFLIDAFDLLIGCSAIHYDLTLITDNIRHLGRLPVKIENWVSR